MRTKQGSGSGTPPARERGGGGSPRTSGAATRRGGAALPAPAAGPSGRNGYDAFRLLVEHSVLAMAVHEIVRDETGRPVDYIFLSANSAFEEHTGLQVSTLIGRPVTEVLPGIRKSPLLRIYGEVMDTRKPVTFEQFFQPLNRHFSVSAFALDETRFATVFTDVTAQKEQEAQTRNHFDLQQIVGEASTSLASAATEEEFDAAVNEVLRRLAGFFRVDRGYLFQFSADVERMTNTHEWCAPGVAPQKNRLQDLCLDQLPWWKEQILKRRYVHLPDIALLPPTAKAERREFKAEKIRSLLCLPTISPEGRMKGFMGFDAVRRAHAWPEEQIVLLQLVANAVGAALARRRAEEALRESQRVLADILESSLSGYWDWNLPAGTEYLSPALKRMFGYEDVDLPNLPESWQKLIFPEDLPGVMRVLERHVQSRGRIPFYKEVRYRHRNGSTVWVICAGRVIEWAPDGAPVRMVGCHIDITHRKNSEAEIEKATLNEQQRIGRDLHDGVGQMLTASAYHAHAISEELRRKGADEAADLLKLARHIERVGREVHEIARGLVSENFGPDTLVSAFQDLAANTREHFGVDCRLACSQEIPAVEDRAARELFRIGQEAVHNAARHSRATRIRIRLQADRGGLTLSVRDNGVGLPRSANGRSGVGLRTMHYRAEGIGAALRVGRARGGGTAVECRLPRTRPSGEGAGP